MLETTGIAVDTAGGRPCSYVLHLCHLVGKVTDTEQIITGVGSVSKEV